jgi:hypothetical protein
MATIQAKRLQEALQKAKKVGRVEDQITLCGCKIVLQSLGPDEYEAILAEVAELDEMAYLHAFQLGHVSRAIVEIDGMDLREVDSVEVEVPADNYVTSVVAKTAESAQKAVEVLAKEGLKATISPPDGATVRTVKIERHKWLTDEYLKTWGREAIMVAWRKFVELIAAADLKATEGVQFKIPDESAEDKFRRLLADAKEAEEDLPDDLVKRLLDESGYIKKSTPEELAAINERARQFAKEQAEKKAQEADGVPQEEPAVPQPSPDPTPEVQGATVPVDPQALMRNRRPLNDRAVDAPVPSFAAVPSRRAAAAVPAQIRQAAEEHAEVTSNRAAQIAALEAQADPTLPTSLVGARPMPPSGRDIPELSKPAPGIDGRAVHGIVDRPPVAGINPRYRPQQR